MENPKTILVLWRKWINLKVPGDAADEFIKDFCSKQPEALHYSVLKAEEKGLRKMLKYFPDFGGQFHILYIGHQCEKSDNFAQNGR